MTARLCDSLTELGGCLKSRNDRIAALLESEPEARLSADEIFERVTASNSSAGNCMAEAAVSPDANARVRNAQDLLVFMGTWRAGSEDAVRSAAGPELMQIIDESAKTRWFPLSEDARFVDAVIEGLGEQDAEELWFAYAARFVETPLQKAIFEGARRLFGLSVGSLCRIVPHVWSSSYRSAGRVRHGRVDPHSCELIFDDLPAAMVERRGYFILLRGLFRGMYRMCETPVDFDWELKAQEAKMQGRFRWPARKGPAGRPGDSGILPMIEP